MKNSDKLKKDGKITMKGPKVKERKKFAPPTQVQKSKKNYDRKKPIDEDEEEKSCWKGYKKDGTKKKGGKTVNNCIKENNIVEFIEAVLTKDYAKANSCLKKEVETKLAEKIKGELNTPLF